MRLLPLRALRHFLMIGLALSSCSGSDASGRPPAAAAQAVEFDGAVAMGYVRRQLSFGPRVPGTPAHRAASDWLIAELRAKTDSVTVQEWTHTTADGRRLPMRNMFARINPAATQRVLLLAHWDSRPTSEKAADPAQVNLPVPGANDGASGVAILLGVADALKARPATNIGVDLLFVDGEDWGSFDTNTDVLIGSKYWADHMPAGYAPMFGLLFDMVGDAFPSFLYETNSMQAAPEVIQRVWGVAQELGHANVFQPREYGPITDDHLPLIAKGLKVIDIIDLDYAWHHTPEDTEDKVSQRTLQIVGDVAMAVLRGI